MVDDDFLTPPPSHHITPASNSNTTALPTHPPMDRSEKKRTLNLRYLSSKSQSMNERLPKAQQHNAVLPWTLPLMKTIDPTHISPTQVPQVIAPIRPPLKPPDYHCQQKTTLQPSSMIPRSVFRYSTNNTSYRPATTHDCQNKALQRNLLEAAKQATRAPTLQMPSTNLTMMADNFQAPTHGHPSMDKQMTDNPLALTPQTKSALCQDKTATEPSGWSIILQPPDYSGGWTSRDGGNLQQKNNRNNRDD